MTWDPKAPYLPEVQKCRPRLLQFCQGQGLDLGCGAEKIKAEAIGVDIGKGKGSDDLVGVADFSADIETGLSLFAPGIFDYIFSSHFLEHVRDPAMILHDWWRLIRHGGNLVLYLPHKDLYPRMGTHGANVDHRSDFDSADILAIMDKFASYKVLVDEVHSEENEYSFSLVLQKIGNVPGVALKHSQVRPEKKALVIRYGGIGDAVMATPIFRLLKEDGYHVTLNCTPTGKEVTQENPNIDEYIIQAPDEVPNRDLEDYWEGLSKGYDRVINLSSSIEKALLAIKGHTTYAFTDEERRALYDDVNYYDWTLEWAGYKGRIERPRGELFLSEEEEMNARVFRESFDGRFIVLWVLAGSGLHKTFPYGAMAMHEFLGDHPEALFITVGGYAERLLELANDEGPNFMFRCGKWNIRNTIMAAKYADLVIGGETGALNIAGAFDTPKLCMLTHSSHGNLAKYWKNDYSTQSTAHCSPCHKMIYSRDECPLNPTFNMPICAVDFSPDQILQRMKEVHRLWLRRNSTLISLPGSGTGGKTRKAGRKGGSIRRVTGSTS